MSARFRRFAGISMFIVATSMVASGRARSEPPTRQACLDAYEQGQRLRRAGKFREARRNLIVCARDPCPSVFQPECVRWLSELDEVFPSVVIQVARGNAAVADARVLIDGQMVADKLDGRDIPVDPGEHVFRVEIAGGPAIERREVLAEGDKARRLVFEVSGNQTSASESREAPGTAAGSRAPAWPAMLATGVSAVALGSFGYFGATGLARRSTLDQCGRHCQQSDIDYTRTHFTIADVSLGVSVVAAGVATYLWIRWMTAPKKRGSSAYAASVR